MQNFLHINQIIGNKKLQELEKKSRRMKMQNFLNIKQKRLKKTIHFKKIAERKRSKIELT